ncbi:MAG: hypothetical protein AABW82_01550 [Nanoarchaeota archaeon]
MTYSYLIPDWFFKFGIGMEILFGIITISIAIIAFSCYKTCREDSLKRFGLGFLLISLSYLTWAIINIILLKDTGTGYMILTTEGLPLIYISSIYLHMALFISGLITLAYTTFKIEKGELYYLLLGLGLLVLASSFNKLLTFRILSVFLLTFISYNYILEWIKNKNKKTLIIFSSFLLLLLSNLDLVFSDQFYSSYVISHILELCAYSIMLFGLVRTLKK